MLTTAAPTARPVLVVDGTESVEGRALLLLSALHYAAPAFTGWKIAVMGDPDAAVRAAAEALSWDTGLDISPFDGAPAHAKLYAAVACRTTAHLPLAWLASSRVPAVIAIQFPDARLHDTPVFALQRAAHDPVLLAGVLRARAGVATAGRDTVR